MAFCKSFSVLKMWSSGRHNINIAMRNGKNTPELLQSSQRSDQMKMDNMVNSASRKHGTAGEIMQYDYDFDDEDPKMFVVEKRQKQEYYDEYAANDLRENGMYPPHSGGAFDEGRSRNRNKEFDSMNQEIQQSRRKNQRVRPAQHQLELPRKQLSDSPNIAGSGIADSKMPLNRNAGQLTGSDTAGGKGLIGEQAKVYSREFK